MSQALDVIKLSPAALEAAAAVRHVDCDVPAGLTGFTAAGDTLGLSEVL